MKSLTRRPSLMLLLPLLVAALLILLPLLAFLQYRWLGEVSAAERERMQANLRTSAERFCADFDRELTSVYAQLQNLPRQPGEQSGSDLSPVYASWLANPQRPKLVREIYRTWFDDNGQLALVYFNPASGSFEPVEWPDRLKDLRDRFESQRQVQQSTQMILRSVLARDQEQLQNRLARGFVFQIALGQIADEIPALVVPDVSAHLPAPGLDQFSQGKRVCTVAVLDLDYIKNELIPDLAKRHFGQDGARDYNLAVVRRGENKDVIYRTGANLPITAFEQNDARSGLFRIRAEEADRIFITGVHNTAVPSAQPSPSGKDKRALVIQEADVAGILKKESNRVAVSVLQNDVSLHKVEDGEKVRIERSLPKHLKPGEEGSWQLLVKHRAGSLDAAVGNVRRRNLAISFGILLLLGASVGFIVMSSRRAQRLATQQMEFVAGVSHELRTPLAVICSAAENLADGVPGLIDNRDQIKRYGGLIRDEGRRLTGMVEQVLEFAGAQSGRKTYDLRPTELDRVIEDAVAACHLQLAEGDFQIEKNIAGDLPTINADAPALGRAIQNLLNNAMKYSGDSRWIRLNVEMVKTDRGDEIQIKISDRGLGVAPSELPHIFEPFYRGKEVVAGQIHGNGLGLSLVKHIAEAHGGRVRVESKVGQGSEFNLTLPVKAADESAVEISREPYEQTHLAR